MNTLSDVKHPELGRCRAEIWQWAIEHVYGKNAHRRTQIPQQCSRKAVYGNYCKQHAEMKLNQFLGLKRRNDGR